MKLNTIKQKLLLLLLLSIGGSMTLAGITLSIIIRSNYENNLLDTFDNFFDRAETNFKQIHSDAKETARKFSEHAELINSLNLISEYSDPDNYQAIIFDREKKEIASKLINHLKSANFQQIRIYDKLGWLVAFASDKPLRFGIVSFDKGKPVVLASTGFNPSELSPISADEILIPLRLPADRKNSRSHFTEYRQNFGFEISNDVVRHFPDGSARHVGQLIIDQFIDENTLLLLAKGTQIRHSILFSNNQFIGDNITDLDISKLHQMVTTKQHNAYRHLPLNNETTYMEGLALPVSSGRYAFLIARIERTTIQQQVDEALYVMVAVFAISALILLPLGLLFARRSITAPIDMLVTSAHSIADSNYNQINIDLVPGEEIKTLANTLNIAASTVKQREEDLRNAQSILEQRVRERTKDISEISTKLQLVMDNIPQFIFWKDRDSVYQGCNLNFLKACGLSSIDEVIGKTDFDMPWSDTEARLYREWDQRVMSQDQAEFNIQETQKTQDGKVIHVETNKVPIHDSDGNVVGIIGTYEDITEKKLVQAELAANEAKFRSLYELSPIGIAMNRLDGSFVEANEAFLKFTGYNMKQLSALSYWELTPEEYAEKEQEQLDNLNKNGEYGPYEKEYIHKEGYRFPVLLEGKLIEDVNGEKLIYSVVQNITEQKNYQNELMHAKELAENASMAKSDFLSRMSHELRTPMNAILGFAQLIKYGSLYSDREEDKLTLSNVDEILAAGEHLLELINEILDLSRIESGEIEIHSTQIDLTELCNNCISLVSSLARSNDVDLIKEYNQSDELFVFADSTRLRQVIINLLSNGIKYNHNGGHVRLKYQKKDNGYVHIEVIDSGIGIAPENISRLFTPFERLDIDEYKIEGTGIGLVICKQLVEEMQGSIGVHSERGRGSTFWFELPLYIDEDAVDESSNSSASQAINPRKKILYIEDNAANMRLMTNILTQRDDCILTRATTAAEGIKKAHSEQPDLILMDIGLPDMDGNKALLELKKDPQTAQIPAIAISANAMSRDIDYTLSIGFRHYLTKPIDIIQLNTYLDQLLNETK